MRNKLTGMFDERATVVEYIIGEKQLNTNTLMMKSHLMLKRHLFFVFVENSATPFPFQKRCGAWHAPVLWCRDHLMVVLCSDLGRAASEKLHQLPLFAARTIRLNATSPRSPSAHG